MDVDDTLDNCAFHVMITSLGFGGESVAKAMKKATKWLKKHESNISIFDITVSEKPCYVTIYYTEKE